MAKEFQGRAALVTGASSGIGRAVAIELGAAGMEVWLVGRNAEELQATAAAIADRGGPPAQCKAIDLRQRGPVAALIEEIGRANPHLFVVVNNAGVMHPEPIMSGTLDRWQAMFDINVMAMLESCKATVEIMRRQGKPGHIINLGSVAARFEIPGVYGATKQAVEAIGVSLRQELEEDDIRVATIIPGGFATQLARGFTPEGLANIAANFEARGLEFGGPGAQRLIADPLHIARLVLYILEAPIDLNFHEILIRPPVSLTA